ncbi:MAG: hypothetical protein HGA47_09620 [Zoogloea sp.]|nr:hypothetical protein [Zoogloea sp.]
MTGNTYLTTEELAARIKYDSRTIRERLKDSVLIEGIHYLRPFGGRKILFIWERIEKDMALGSINSHLCVPDDDQSGNVGGRKAKISKVVSIPMASGGACRIASMQGNPKQGGKKRNGDVVGKEVRHG